MTQSLRGYAHLP